MTTPQQQQARKRRSAPSDYTLPDGRGVTWVALVRMLVALHPNRCPDLATITAVFGAAVFTSLGQVAEAFVVHPGVVRADWCNQGLPGNPDDGYPIAEVFQWYLHRQERQQNL
jgi:hypothetical protein